MQELATTVCKPQYTATVVEDTELTSNIIIPPCNESLGGVLECPRLSFHLSIDSISSSFFPKLHDGFPPTTTMAHIINTIRTSEPVILKEIWHIFKKIFAIFQLNKLSIAGNFFLELYSYNICWNVSKQIFSKACIIITMSTCGSAVLELIWINFIEICHFLK